VDIWRLGRSFRDCSPVFARDHRRSTQRSDARRPWNRPFGDWADRFQDWRPNGKKTGLALVAQRRARRPISGSRS